jgi:hypothetical protein
LKLHGLRGGRELMCPGCGILATGHQYYSGREADTAMISYPSPKEYNSKEAEKRYPQTYLYNEKRDEIKEAQKDNSQEASFCVLYAAKFMRDTRGAELKLHTQCKLIQHIGNDSPDENYCDQLQKFFAFLHPQEGTGIGVGT